MSQINIGGVLKGGVAAGVIMNISEFILNVPVVGAQMEAELASHNLPPVSTAAIATFTFVTLLLGVVWSAVEMIIASAVGGYLYKEA